jgi:prephenate dehydratase
MIRKYELKIVLSCNVESANGKITKFALLKRDITKLTCPETSVVGEYLEIGFNFGEKAKLNEVLTAASYFGFELNKINSLPIYYSEKEYYFDVVFNGEGDLEKLIYWLELEIPRYEILGIYTEIKTI